MNRPVNELVDQSFHTVENEEEISESYIITNLTTGNISPYINYVTLGKNNLNIIKRMISYPYNVRLYLLLTIGYMPIINHPGYPEYGNKTVVEWTLHEIINSIKYHNITPSKYDIFSYELISLFNKPLEKT